MKIEFLEVVAVVVVWTNRGVVGIGVRSLHEGTMRLDMGAMIGGYAIDRHVV